MCQSNFQKRTEENSFLGLTDSQKQEQIDSHKKKMLGNIKFIGDLFKNKLIHEKIVHHIVAKLLGKPPSDENQRKMWFNVTVFEKLLLWLCGYDSLLLTGFKF